LCSITFSSLFLKSAELPQEEWKSQILKKDIGQVLQRIVGGTPADTINLNIKDLSGIDTRFSTLRLLMEPKGTDEQARLNLIREMAALSDDIKEVVIDRLIHLSQTYLTTNKNVQKLIQDAINAVLETKPQKMPAPQIAPEKIITKKEVPVPETMLEALFKQVNNKIKEPSIRFRELYNGLQQKRIDKRLITAAETMVAGSLNKDPHKHDQAIEAALNMFAQYQIFSAKDPLSWCDCAQAPGILRIAFAARIALDALVTLQRFSEITITSFAAGDLLQELLVLASLITIWPDKPLTINVVLIDPEPRTKQNIPLVEQNIKTFLGEKAIVKPFYYTNHRAYMKAVEQNEAPKADVLYITDYHLVELSNDKNDAINGFQLFGQPPHSTLPILLFNLVDRKILKRSSNGDRLGVYIYKNRFYETYKKGIEASLKELPRLLPELPCKETKDESFLACATEVLAREIAKGQKYVVNMELAFKELIINTLMSKGLLYNLNYDMHHKLLIRSDFEQFMKDKAFYTTPTFTDFQNFGKSLSLLKSY